MAKRAAALVERAVKAMAVRYEGRDLVTELKPTDMVVVRSEGSAFGRLMRWSVLFDAIRAPIGQLVDQAQEAITTLRDRVTALEEAAPQSLPVIIRAQVEITAPPGALPAGVYSRTVATPGLRSTDTIVLNRTGAGITGAHLVGAFCAADNVLTATVHVPTAINVGAGATIPAQLTVIREPS